MSQEVLNLVLISAVIVLAILGFSTLVVVVKLYRMHDVKNSNGQYAWMVPDQWADMSGRIMDTQERIVAALGEVAVHNSNTAKLMKSLTDAVLSMRQEINEVKQGMVVQ